MRKLASIREILALTPIEGADRIEVATIDGWKVVVNKGLHHVGEVIVYFEIDSFLPIRNEFEFLRKSSYKKMADGSEGFRLKTIRLRSQVSQGLVMPISILPSVEVGFNVLYLIGDDVTDILGVTKYEAPVPANLAGEVKGMFPSFLSKTDEERAQNFSNEWNEFSQYKYFVTEKLDGTSFTSYFNNGDFGVCSRNLDLREDENQTHWKLAKQLDIKNKLISLNRNLAIQGEVIGEGVQGNPYKILGQKLFVFNIFDIDNHEYLPKLETEDIVKKLELDSVPVIYTDFNLPKTIDEALLLAEGKSVLNDKTEREGLVWVSMDSKKRISFKTISNKFLLSGGE